MGWFGGLSPYFWRATHMMCVEKFGILLAKKTIWHDFAVYELWKKTPCKKLEGKPPK